MNQIETIYETQRCGTVHITILLEAGEYHATVKPSRSSPLLYAAFPTLETAKSEASHAVREWLSQIAFEIAEEAKTFCVSFGKDEDYPMTEATEEDLLAA